MKIIKDAIAGTLESSDIQVKVSPHKGLEIVIHSDVMHQFGDQITSTVKETLKKLGLTDGLIIVEDKGALDCAIKARVEVAVLRGADVNELNWSQLK
ncbi:citrate lyase subunit gamma (acyl carrier protein) [Orbus hercynius]|uniref:Citrate lyase acyl carrier protein n=1 Tax=Orbus hercynius TaxID=593135 RepID=A0A495RJC7_9GAMM|nr:citrate lyase acyl carrier protein [Orbus hercynius]RKS86898.1 citrate lyase subunit gamma (acyl carrier protein) [Orbus hercynius]